MISMWVALGYVGCGECSLLNLSNEAYLQSHPTKNQKVNDNN